METTGWRPIGSQELLLRAALRRGETSLRSWEEWKASVEVEHLDAGSIRLLPLLYHSLKSQGVEDPLLPRFKGIHRQSWYKNQLLLRSVTPVLQSLQAAGVETMLLKGAALGPLYYRDYGLRPMNDFDILVPLSQASRTVEMLGAAGWKRGPGPELPTADTLFLAKSQEYRSPGGQSLDLHWHVMDQWFEPESEAKADETFWRDALPATLPGVATSVLNPADLLLHVCVHGTEGQKDVPPVRWVADALTILGEAHGTLAWDRLLDQARARRVSLPLRETLGYLAETMGAPIPTEFLQRLADIPTTSEQQWEYVVWTTPPPQRDEMEKLRGPVTTLRRHYHRYSRWAGGPGRRAGGGSLLHYLQYVWCVPSLRRLPLALLSRSLEKVRRFTTARQNRRAHLLAEAQPDS